VSQSVTSSNAWSATVDAALEAVDSHGKRTKKHSRLGRAAGRVAAALSHANSATWLHYLFRFGCALIGANLAGYWVLNWSQTESQRFPSGNPQAIEYFFPGFGHCEPVEYFFLLADAMLLAGVAAYFVAWWLERKCEG